MFVLILIMTLDQGIYKTEVERFDTFDDCVTSAEFYWEKRMPTDKTGLKLGCFKYRGLK